MPPRRTSVLRIRSDETETMYMTADNRSLHRGRRVAPRTEVLRPCLMWREEQPGEQFQGVVLDLNPYGLRVRMIDSIPEGESVVLQMMRDDEFRVPLSPPIRGHVMRSESSSGGFVDHGIKVQLSKIKRVSEQVPRRITPVTFRGRTAPRMHTADFLTGNRGGRRTGRGRG